MTMKKSETLEAATLGGGCFWCTEAVFDNLNGISKVESGYSGGTVANPTYQQVCTEKTGHAEVVQVTFDPQIISYEDILRVFFTIHDPTTLNRQGDDVGTQYRSVIFYHDEKQRQTAEKTVKEMESQKIWDDPIMTEISPFRAFYKAESYHQEYFANNPDQPYCCIVIAPKVAKFRKSFQDRLRK
jgi:peptide-methionine (S)-S-oxide reductase